MVIDNASVESTQNDPSYSQNRPVIHSASVESTPNPVVQRNAEPEVRGAYPVDERLIEESPGDWYPAETLADINLRKAAEARAHKHEAHKHKARKEAQ